MVVGPLRIGRLRLDSLDGPVPLRVFYSRRWTMRREGAVEFIEINKPEPGERSRYYAPVFAAGGTDEKQHARQVQAERAGPVERPVAPASTVPTPRQKKKARASGPRAKVTAAIVRDLIDGRIIEADLASQVKAAIDRYGTNWSTFRRAREDALEQWRLCVQN